MDVLGTPAKVEILNSSTDSIKEWFNGWVRRRFEPSSVGFTNTPGSCLVLVRAAIKISGDPSVLLPREAPWIKAYTSEDFVGDELPTVTQLVFEPSSQENRNPNMFELVSSGSDWSTNVLKFSFERRSNGWAAVRRWKKPDEFIQ